MSEQSRKPDAGTDRPPPGYEGAEAPLGRLGVVVSALKRFGEIISGLVGLGLFVVITFCMITSLRSDDPGGDPWAPALFVSMFFMVGIPGALFAFKCFFGPAKVPGPEDEDAHPGSKNR